MIDFLLRYYDFLLVPLLSLNSNKSKSTTHTLIRQSAILKIGQTCRSIKSLTPPSRNLSHALPSVHAIKGMTTNLCRYLKRYAYTMKYKIIIVNINTIESGIGMLRPTHSLNAGVRNCNCSPRLRS